MACFPSRNGYVLVNNHEVGGSEPHRVPVLPGLTYDPGAGGGTTNIEVDRNGNRLREYVSVAGTHNNCAGGLTPWDTWLTCEETEQRAGGAFQKDHGYIFEVQPFHLAANLDPVPLKFLGRYAHEAVAVDPRTLGDLRHRGRGRPERSLLPLDPAEGLLRWNVVRCVTSRSRPAATPRASSRR